MLLLFAGGLVETLASDKGQMTLHEPARGGTADALSESDRFSSYYEWEIAVRERTAGRHAHRVRDPVVAARGPGHGAALRATLARPALRRGGDAAGARTAARAGRGPEARA